MAKPNSAGLGSSTQAADTGRFGSIRGGLGTKFAFVPKLDGGLLRQESPDGEVDSSRTESTDLTDASTRRSPRRGFVAGPVVEGSLRPRSGSRKSGGCHHFEVGRDLPYRRGLATNDPLVHPSATFTAVTEAPQPRGTSRACRSRSRTASGPRPRRQLWSVVRAVSGWSAVAAQLPRSLSVSAEREPGSAV